MSDPATLLDTPKKRSLESQSTALRASLKEFERTFATEHDRKPTRNDIKAHEEIAAQYKTYNRVREVLCGKLSYEEFIAPAKSPMRKVSHKRIDSGVSWTTKGRDGHGTPRKQLHPSQLDPYDTPSSMSPKPALLSAIGPTPQRDGRVLGLFDMMSASTTKSQTLSSGSRKRKLGTAFEESPPKIRIAGVIGTPQRRPTGGEEDILRHLMGTPGMTPQTGRRNHSRTPVSEGRKFMLSQLFATPSAIKYTDGAEGAHEVDATPLKNDLLKSTPKMDISHDPGVDATPAYLRRSTSFKDRLMSATNPSSSGKRARSPISRGRPFMLHHFRKASKPLSQIVSDLRAIEEGDHEDDLDALRELEGTDVNIVMSGNRSTDGNDASQLDGDENQSRVWKKRGQKRTTKRSRIRPAIAKIAKAPKFVSAEDHNNTDESLDEDDQNDNDGDDNDYAKTSARVPKSKLRHRKGAAKTSGIDEEVDELALEEEEEDAVEDHRYSRSKTDAKTGKKKKTSSETDKKTGKINPNAQSHMNFRSLKIRNKNSKAKGGARRFRR